MSSPSIIINEHTDLLGLILSADGPRYETEIDAEIKRRESNDEFALDVSEECDDQSAPDTSEECNDQSAPGTRRSRALHRVERIQRGRKCRALSTSDSSTHHDLKGNSSTTSSGMDATNSSTVQSLIPTKRSHDAVDTEGDSNSRG